MPLLVPGCVRGRLGLFHVEHDGLQGLVCHGVVSLVEGRHHLGLLGDLGVLELALVPWDHFLDDDAIHVPKDGLVNR